MSTVILSRCLGNSRIIARHMATQSSPRTPRPQRGRPVQDIVPPGQQNFPAVGMTLSSYKHDPFTNLKSEPMQNTTPKPGRLRRAKRVFSLKRAVLFLSVLIVLAGGWLGWKFIYNAHKLFGGSVLSIFTSSKLKGEDDGRVNILLAGNSADDKGHQGGTLTDSIMLLSIDTRNHQAFMLSVPRDLYVSIPGHRHQKINAVYPDGNASHFSQNGYPNGGMGLLEKTISQDFGIPIHYYALIDYNAFKQSVDAVGGIDINIQSPDKRGLYDPDIDYATGKKLVPKTSNGWHHLNGQQALDLARARGDAYGSYGFPQSDFDRTAHQRQMLLALKSKATSAGVVTNPVRLGELFDSIGNNVKTDLTLSNVHRLYDLTKDIGGNNIQSLSLNNANGKNLLMNYTAPNGESALAPAVGLDNYSQIRAYLQRLTSNNPVVKENATVVLLNATDVVGLAAKQQTFLESKYINVTQIADATANRATTQVIDNSGGKMPSTLKLLQSVYGSNVTTQNPYKAYSQASFIVVLGADRLASGQ